MDLGLAQFRSTDLSFNTLTRSRPVCKTFGRTIMGRSTCAPMAIA